MVVFGQELPEVTATLTAQLFGLATALVGLATFALVLALLQQVVLEVIDSNVAQGSRVYERDHVRRQTAPPITTRLSPRPRPRTWKPSPSSHKEADFLPVVVSTSTCTDLEP